MAGKFRSAVGEVLDLAPAKLLAAAAELLDMNLIDELVAGFREVHELTSAARKTLAETSAPKTQEVPLVDITIRIAHRPYIIVLVDGKRVATVQLNLSLVFDVNLQAQIRAGKLIAIPAATCDITASLVINDDKNTIVVTGPVTIDLPGEIALRVPIRLLPDSEYPPR